MVTLKIRSKCWQDQFPSYLQAEAGKLNSTIAKMAIGKKMLATYLTEIGTQIRHFSGKLMSQLQKFFRPINLLSSKTAFKNILL